MRTRRPFWERWSTRIAVVAMAVVVLGGGVLANVDSVPGHAPWLDRVSTVLQQIGLATALDAYENWLDGRHAQAEPVSRVA